MAGKQKRVVGNAREDWWKSSDLEEQRNQLQQDQWERQYNQNLSEFKSKEKARKDLSNSMSNVPKNPVAPQQKSVRIYPSKESASQEVASKRRKIVASPIQQPKQSRQESTRNSQWEDEFKRRSTKRK